ncbi:MAG: hypothetical protein V8S92_03360 [Oscillospiraceae bacterium]
MMSNEFEKALDAFLEGAEADEAHQALYDIIRAAFLAGCARRAAIRRRSRSSLN